METIFRTEGIILRILPFRDHDLIITVFSLERGIIKFIGKGFANPKRTHGVFARPLTRGEFVFKESRGELQKCQEISLIEPYLKLRENLSSLETGCLMLQGIIESQSLEKPAPDLYQLLIRYMEAIPDFPNAHVLSSSFLLKTLYHDGWIDGISDFSEEWRQLTLCRSLKELSKVTLNNEVHKEVYAYFQEKLRQ